MNDEHELESEQGQDVPTNGTGPADGGPLSARMAQRADYLETHQAEWFGVPGYEDLVEVELRALSFKTSRAIQHRHERVRDEPTRELYILADTIITATLGFRQVTDGGHSRLEDDWVTLARRLPDPPEDLTPRRAVLFLVGDKRLPFLVNDWAEWAKSVRAYVDEELVRDFDRTG